MFRSPFSRVPFRLVSRNLHRPHPAPLRSLSRQLPREPFHVRNQSYYRYQRYNNRPGPFELLQRWAARPTFMYEAGGMGMLAGGFYVYNLEEVPISGRKRFNCFSKEWEESTAEMLYRQTLQEYQGRILPPFDPRVQMVERIMQRLIPSSGLTDQKWEVHVIDDKLQNAFVIPGGKVFVFSGILPICGNDDALAFVLGHEIAHNVARHSSERMSKAFPLYVLAWIVEIFYGLPRGMTNMILDFAFVRRGGREQESEADYIGQLMMAQSCYDPNAAIMFWQRMSEAQHGEPPEFLSTHPSNYNRMQKLQQWLPEAQEKRSNSDCQNVLDYADHFRRSLRLSK